jgi:hypothetical protein
MPKRRNWNKREDSPNVEIINGPCYAVDNHMVKGIMEKLTIAHLVKQFSVCKIPKIITMLTKVFYRILSWASYFVLV